MNGWFILWRRAGFLRPRTHPIRFFLLFFFLACKLTSWIEGANISGIRATDGLAWDGESFWFASMHGFGALWRVDPAGQVLERIPTKDFIPSGLAFAEGHLWACDGPKNRICKLGRSGSVIRSIPSPRPKPRGLAYDGHLLWVSCQAEGSLPHTLHGILPLDGSVQASFKSPFVLHDLEWDGSFLWACSSEQRQLFRFTRSGEGWIVVEPPCPFPSAMAFDGNRLWIVDIFLSTGDVFALELSALISPKQDSNRALDIGLLFDKAEVLVQRNDWMKAAQVWQECALLWPEGPEVHFNLAASLDWAGESYQRVSEEYRRCLRLSPCHPLAAMAAFNHGLSAFKEGRYLDGITFMQMAGKHNPSLEADAFFSAAYFTEKSEEWSRAAELYQRVANSPQLQNSRYLAGFTTDQVQRILQYFSARCESQIQVAQLKMSDASLLTGFIVAGELGGIQYGTSDAAGGLTLQTLKGELVEVEKEKIRFFKFVPKVSHPTPPRDIPLNRLSFSFSPFRPVGRKDLIHLSKNYASEGRAKEASFRQAIAMAKKDPTVQRLLPLPLPTPPVALAAVSTPVSVSPKTKVPIEAPTVSVAKTSPASKVPIVSEASDPMPTKAPKRVMKGKTLQDEPSDVASTPWVHLPKPNLSFLKEVSLPLSVMDSVQARARQYGPAVLGGTCSLLAMVFLLVPPLRKKKTLKSRVKQDYTYARGTRQLRLLRNAMIEIEHSIRSKKKSCLDMDKDLKTMERQLRKAKDEERKGRLEREIKRVGQLKLQAYKELDEICALKKDVEEGIASLSAVNLSDFIKATRGDQEARQRVSSHFMGLFPPWEMPPAWFEKASKFEE